MSLSNVKSVEAGVLPANLQTQPRLPSRKKNSSESLESPSFLENFV
jgi:hypothetical protein